MTAEGTVGAPTCLLYCTVFLFYNTLIVSEENSQHDICLRGQAESQSLFPKNGTQWELNG
jgi:hypothetical protein